MWISVKDSLPEDDTETYLIYCPELDNKDFPGHPVMVSNPCYLRKHVGHITHWMRIPKIPEEK